MNDEQIDMAMETNSLGARQYFQECGHWIKANRSNLVKLHQGFQAETKSTLDISVFCSNMFNQTKEGQAAAERLLKISRVSEALLSTHE